MKIVTEVTVLSDKADSLFDESAVTVKLKDEGGGPFVEIQSYSDEDLHNAIRLDFSDWDSLTGVIKQMQAAATLLSSNELV